MIDQTTARTALALALAATVGCGDYVRYKDGTVPGLGSPAQGGFDEATKAKLAGATHLEHLIFDRILAEHVAPSSDRKLVLFDYDRLKNDPEASVLLDQYVAMLDLVSPEKLAGTKERLAYWTNGYNASVIRGVLNAYNGNPRYSVSEDNFLFFDLPVHRFGGLALSLNQLEHVIIRGDYEHAAFRSADPALRDRLRALHNSLWSDQPYDARAHFTVNCASLSCPNLRAEAPFAYRPDNLDAQLDQDARAFVNNEVKGAGSAGISQLFNWYAKDFEAMYGNPAGFIRRFRENGLTGVNLDRFLPYDWSLNIGARR